MEGKYNLAGSGPRGANGSRQRWPTRDGNLGLKHRPRRHAVEDACLFVFGNRLQQVGAHFLGGFKLQDPGWVRLFLVLIDPFSCSLQDSMVASPLVDHS